MENKKLVHLNCTLSIKKADNPKRICHNCALSVGDFGCMKRSACPDDGTGLNLYFENIELIKPESDGKDRS